MEKHMYVVWRNTDQTAEDYRDHFIGSTIKVLQGLGAEKVRLTVIDNDISPASKLNLLSAQLTSARGKPDAVISLWTNDSHSENAIKKTLLDSCSSINGYLVKEVEPLPNTKHPYTEGMRTYGMNQVVFLQKPPRLSYEQWIDIWQNSHTKIAIDTQSTFGYRQNVVVKTLSDNALKVDAIVEENFPPEAMTSSHAFYRATGDDKLLKKHQSEMITSVQRFVDFDKIDCLPMSEYNF